MRSDGRVLAVGHRDGTVTLIDARTLRRALDVPRVPRTAGPGMGYLPRSRLLVVGGDYGYPRPGRPGSPRQARGPAARPPRTAAHARLQRRRTAHGDGEPGRPSSLWTLRSGRADRPSRALHRSRPRGRVAQPRRADAGHRAPRRKASRSSTWPRSGAARADPGPRPSASRASRPTGASSSGEAENGWARLWSTKTWRPASARTRRVTPDAVLGLSMSPDGRTLATGSTDGSVRLYDLPTQQPLGAPTARRAQPRRHTAVHARRRLPVRHHRRRTRLPLGRTAIIVGAPRLRRGRPHAHPNRVERRPTRSPLCTRLHALEAQAGACA